MQGLLSFWHKLRKARKCPVKRKRTICFPVLSCQTRLLPYCVGVFETRWSVSPVPGHFLAFLGCCVCLIIPSPWVSHVKNIYVYFYTYIVKKKVPVGGPVLCKCWDWINLCCKYPKTSFPSLLTGFHQFVFCAEISLMIFFFPELFLLNSFLNEQEGNFFLYEWSQTELDLDALGSFYKSWLAYNFREKNIFW